MPIVKTVVALAMLVRRFNFQMAVGAPPVSLLLFVIFSRSDEVSGTSLIVSNMGFSINLTSRMMVLKLIA